METADCRRRWQRIARYAMAPLSTAKTNDATNREPATLSESGLVLISAEIGGEEIGTGGEDGRRSESVRGKGCPEGKGERNGKGGGGRDGDGDRASVGGGGGSALGLPAAQYDGKADKDAVGGDGKGTGRENGSDKVCGDDTLCGRESGGELCGDEACRSEGAHDDATCSGGSKLCGDEACRSEGACDGGEKTCNGGGGKRCGGDDSCNGDDCSGESGNELCSDERQ